MLSFTVCIATKDRSLLLIKTLTEVNSQANKIGITIPVIICDDFSKKWKINNKKLIDFNNLDVTSLRNNSNKGLSATRNRLIKNVKTNYLIFLDDDDLWPPHFLTNFIIRNLNFDNSNVDAIFGYNVPSLRILGDEFLSSKNLVKKMFLPPVGCQIFKLETLKRYNIFYDEKVKSGVDHDLFFSIAEKNFNCKITYTKNLKSLIPLNGNRITTNFDLRIKEVEKSIQRWKLRSFVDDKEFWTNIKNGYQLHIRYKHFRMFLISGDFLSALKYYDKKLFKQLLFDALFRIFGFRSGMKLKL